MQLFPCVEIISSKFGETKNRITLKINHWHQAKFGRPQVSHGRVLFLTGTGEINQLIKTGSAYIDRVRTGFTLMNFTKRY